MKEEELSNQEYVDRMIQLPAYIHPCFELNPTNAQIHIIINVIKIHDCKKDFMQLIFSYGKGHHFCMDGD